MRHLKTLCRCLLGLALASLLVQTGAAEESLGNKIKQIFSTPTPTPHRHRKRTSPSPSPSATAKPRAKAAETPASEKSPSPGKKKKRSATPSPSASATPVETPAPSATPSATPTASETPGPSETPRKKGAPATISAIEIVEYEKYSPELRKVVDVALALTARGLEYKYGSADPAEGGMDCSGFVYYVLTQNGVRDVPRDSSQQYVWVRKAGTFQAVVSRKDDTFELEALHPGDLLFWTGTYSIERDPPITHAMIYLGHEKGTKHRIMVGASDGRTYKGESRYGVSVFDFKVARNSLPTEGRTPTFVGYGRIPGIPAD
ncbi:MAG: NlpC/P60 family protein [Chthoniobacterales bacterium]